MGEENLTPAALGSAGLQLDVCATSSADFGREKCAASARISGSGGGHRGGRGGRGKLAVAAWGGAAASTAAILPSRACGA